MGEHFKRDRILIIDDFPNMCMSIRRMLREVGEENTEFVLNGEEALKLMRKTPYDIVMCDYNLGDGKDGQEVLEEARLTGLLAPTSSFVMITAETTIPYVLGAIEMQPDDYLTKPFNKELLLSRLMRVVEKSAVLGPIRQLVHDEEYAKAAVQCRDHIQQKGRYLPDVSRILGRIYLDTGHHDKAKKLFESLLAKREFRWAKFGLASALYHLGDTIAAINILETLLRENHMFIEAYDLLTQCRLRLQESDKAQSVLDSAVQLCPKSVTRQRQLGEVALENKDLDTANRAYSNAIRLGENSCRRSAEEFIRLSEVQTRQGKPHKALLTLKRGRGAFEHQADHQLRMRAATAGWLVDQNRGNEAVAELEAAKRLYQRQSSAIKDETALELGRAALGIGDEKLGRELLTLVVENNHDDEQFIGRVGDMLTNAGSNIALTELIDSTVNEMRELNSRGVKLTEQGQLNEALKLFEQAAEKVPSNRSFNLNAAQVLIRIMKEKGVDESMKYRARTYLTRVKESEKTDERYFELTRMFKELSGQSI